MSRNSKNVVPEARAALDKFKMEAANEVGVNLNNSYNGDITARQAGSVGGQMVKKIPTIRTMKQVSFERTNRIVDGHKTTVRYIAELTI